MSLQVKVCGLTRPEDARFCAAAGAWLGFIFHPASPRYISPQLAARLETGTATRVGVFVNQSPAEVATIMAEARLDLAQLHGRQGPDFCRAVGPERLIKVFWPQSYDSGPALAADLERFADAAAFFLLDAGLDGGGHGRSLETDRLRDLRPPRPWLLAGGLNPANIARLDLAGLSGLYGLDFNSGLESAPGFKDQRLIQAAVDAVSNLKL